jgi:hypothetical protein
MSIATANPAACGTWVAIGTACGKTLTSWSVVNSGYPRRKRRMSSIGTPRLINIAFDR